MGTQFAGGEYTYLPLLRHAPGWDGLRTPGRLVIYTTLLLGLLAAGAVTALGDALARREGTGPEGAGREGTGPEGATREGSTAGRTARRRWPVWVTAIALLPGLLVLGEGLNKTPHPEVPPTPVAFRKLEGPLLVLPTDPGFDQTVMLWSTDGYPKMVNGGSGFFPNSTNEIRAFAATFPDPASVYYLRGRGIRTVLLVRNRLPGTAWEGALGRPVDGLPLRRTESEDAVVFVIDPA
jgi:hypothetical protein